MNFWSQVKTTFQNWRKHEAMRLAASLAYYTSFSLAPLLLLVISIAGLVFGREAAQGRILEELNGMVGEQSAAAIQSMIMSAWQPGKSIMAMVLSIVGVLLGATGVLAELKGGLNLIWNTEEQGGFTSLLRSRAKYLGLILGIGFLLMVSLAISAALSALGKFFSAWLLFPEILEHAIDFIVSFGVITTLFTLIAKYIPDTYVPWHSAWVGSAFTAFLFTLGKFVLGLYLGKGMIGSTYGTAGGVLIILMWVYYSGLILYFGMEFTKVHHDATV